MRTYIGIAIGVLGLILALYLGIWVLFIGGIVQVINAVKGDVNALSIALGLLRMMSAFAVGFFTFLFIGVIGTVVAGN